MSLKNTKLDQRRKSSTSTKHRRSSDKKSSLDDEEISRKEISSHTTDLQKPKINYQDELVLMFLNSMLDVIVEDWITVPDKTPQVCFCELKSKKSSSASISKDFKDMTPEDLENMAIEGVKGSVLSLMEKSTSKKDSKDSKQLTEQGKHDPSKRKHSKSSDRSKLPERGSSEQRSKSSIKRRHKARSISEGVGSTSSIHTSSMFSSSLNWMISPPDENVIIKFRNGNRYEGPVSKLLMHGFGRFYWANGAVYEGDFVNGYATGHGLLKYSDMSLYHGQFCRSLLHGEGVLNISSTPMIYSGCWKAGEKHGQGWLLYDSGNWYEGEWQNDKRQGTGVRQYKNGTKYQGKWFQGERHGQGTLVWPNNDIYLGNWKHGIIHGYGEYTWNAFLNETFTFPVENTYHGTWINGMRDGVGVMNFGTANGSQLAGMWQQNKKHGPGVLICGNGKVVEKNPLFWYDNPIHIDIEADPGYPMLTAGSKQSVTLIQTPPPEVKSTSTFKLIVDQVRSKHEIEMFGPEILNRIQKHRESTMSETDFLTGREQSSPLCIPMHTPPEKTDFSYFIDKAVQKYSFELYKNEVYIENMSGRKTEIHSSTITKYSKWNLLNFNISSPSNTPKNSIECATARSSELQRKLATFQTLQAQTEEKYLHDAIVRHITNLFKLYDKYATITTTTHQLDFKPVLIRLFLWQMFRDMNLLDHHSLTEMDLILAENPGTSLEYDHYPFEKIYFWQFLQILVSLAWLCHSPTDIRPECKTFGILASIFEKFLYDIIYQEFGFSFSCSLFEYRDLLPIQAVYLLYRSLGEPHTARKFLKSVCTKKRENPPWYLEMNKEEPIRKLTKGVNAVSVGGHIIYFPNDPPVGKRPSEHDVHLPIDDPFRKQLYALRSLRPRKIVKCLTIVCPRILEDGFIVNMDYPLTFIEFYDVFLMCGFMMIDKIRKREERLRLKQEKESQETAIIPKILSNKSKISIKKKTSKK